MNQNMKELKLINTDQYVTIKNQQTQTKAEKVTTKLEWKPKTIKPPKLNRR